MKMLYLTLALFIAPLTQAHEGHDKTPGSLSAPHGGTIQGTKDFYLELVASKSGVKIYPLDHDMKPISPSDFMLTDGTVKFPRRDKVGKAVFSPESDHFTANIDTKGAYRYTLEVVASRKGTKAEKVKFNVEPK